MERNSGSFEFVVVAAEAIRFGQGTLGGVLEIESFGLGGNIDLEKDLIIVRAVKHREVRKIKFMGSEKQHSVSGFWIGKGRRGDQEREQGGNDSFNGQ